MDYFQPWKIVVGKINVKDQVDIQMLREDIFNLSVMTDNEDENQSFVSPDYIPTIFQLRDEIIIPAVKQFSLEQFDFEMVDFEVDTNAKWIREGEGLFPHYHPGSYLSAIIYPNDSKSGLNFFDPRGNACRGYPRSMRTREFGTRSISPREGDVYIFPSYLQHSVSYVQEEVRLSLLHEFYVNGDR